VRDTRGRHNLAGILLVVGSMLWLTARAGLAAEPRRVVSLAPSITETVYALGAGDRLVGVSTYCDYPPEATRVPRVGSFLTPNIEAIIAARPDLVIAIPSPGNRNPVESLERLGLRVLTVDPESIAQTKAAILAIGDALGRAAAAGDLVTGIDARFAAVEARLRGVAARRVLMVVGHTPLIAAGAGTLQDELITRARGQNIARAASGMWPHLNLEFVIAAAPQVIVDTSMGNEERAGAAATMEFWQAFPTIPAVRDRRIAGFGAYDVLRPGPRIGEAFATMARFIHPEAFAEAGRTESQVQSPKSGSPSLRLLPPRSAARGACARPAGTRFARPATRSTQASGRGTWDLGLGTWDFGLGTWDC